MPTLPALTTRTPPSDAVGLRVRVAADDEALLGAVRTSGASAPSGVSEVRISVVGARRSVAEQGRAEPVHGESTTGSWKRGQEVSLALVDHASPSRRAAGRSARGSSDAAAPASGVELLDGLPIAVAAHEYGSVAERTQQLRSLGTGSGPGTASPPTTMSVDALAFDLREHGARARPRLAWMS